MAHNRASRPITLIMAEPASSSPTPSPAPAGAPLSQLRIDRGQASASRRRRPRWGLWAVGALVLAGGAAWLLAPRATAVQTAAVVSTTPSQQYVDLTASGYVVAQRRAAVASKATGRLVELMVREGSRVKKNEVIARLDASDVQAAIAAAEAGVRQAEAGLRQAQVESTNAQAELARSKGLQAQGFISPQAVDTAQTRANAAQASVAAAHIARLLDGIFHQPRGHLAAFQEALSGFGQFQPAWRAVEQHHAQA